MLKRARWLLVSVAVVLLALRSTGQREEDYPQPAGERAGKHLLLFFVEHQKLYKLTIDKREEAFPKFTFC